VALDSGSALRLQALADPQGPHGGEM